MPGKHTRHLSPSYNQRNINTLHRTHTHTPHKIRDAKTIHIYHCSRAPAARENENNDDNDSAVHGGHHRKLSQRTRNEYYNSLSALGEAVFARPAANLYAFAHHPRSLMTTASATGTVVPQPGARSGVHFFVFVCVCVRLFVCVCLLSLAPTR